MSDGEPRPPVFPMDPFLALPDVSCPDGHTMDPECLQGKKDEFTPQLDGEQSRFHRVTDKRRDEYEEAVGEFDENTPQSERDELASDYRAALATLKKAYDGEVARIGSEFTAAVLEDCCSPND